jgi:hypothetical protein
VPPVEMSLDGQQPAAAARGTANPSFLDSLVAKMEGGGQQAPQAGQRSGASPGNGVGTSQRAAVVPPEVTHACERFLTKGPAPLRTGDDRMAFEVAQMCLSEKDTLMNWVENLKFTGHLQRESLTIARSVELGISEYGPEYLASKSAEVLLRRLMALAIAGKAGATNKAWKMASRLEELPGDGIGAMLRTSRLAKLHSEMKTELQVEALLEGDLAKAKGK